MKFSAVTRLFCILGLSTIVSIPFLPDRSEKTAQYYFEITSKSSVDGIAQLFYDIGRGINDSDSARVSISAGAGEQHLRFPLPVGDFRALRYDPIDREGAAVLGDAFIRDPYGHIVMRLAIDQFAAGHDIGRREIHDGKMEIGSTPGGVDPILLINLPGVFQLGELPLWRYLLFVSRQVAPTFLIIFIVVWLVEKWIAQFKNLLSQLMESPRLALSLVGLCAVILSSYPLLFCGKSIVAPNLGARLLYQNYPTLPGYSDDQGVSVAGADVGALMWWHLPVSSIETAAIFHDHELPLWNRYDLCGTPLLGQGLSMIGDPLQFIVILANDTAWSWDLKYLIAKWLLSFGVGLCVLRATKHLPSAIVLAAVVPFIGLFVYRVNHPAIYSACYTPWILLCWLEIATSQKGRSVLFWAGALMLSNWVEMNSGTAKEAYTSLLTLNFVGVLVLCLTPFSLWQRFKRVTLTVVCGIIFFLLSAPVWLTFLGSLTQSYTAYNIPQVFQMQPSLALAFFDEVLFRPYNNGVVLNGSMNFVVLLGVLFFLTNIRRVCAGDRVALGIGLGVLVPIVMIFGVVPPEWIMRIPFIGSLQHTDNSFFCPTIPLLCVVAGYGVREAMRRLAGYEGKGDLAIGALLMGGLVGSYIAFGQTVQRSAFPTWRTSDRVHLDPFVIADLFALVLASILLCLVLRRVLVRRAATPTDSLIIISCLFAIVWRHGLQLKTKFTDYVVSPSERVDFHARSPAVAALKDDQRGEPSRFAGIEQNAFHGWMSMYSLEGLGGADALVSPFYRELEEALKFELVWGWRLNTRAATLLQKKRAYDFLNVKYYLAPTSSAQELSKELAPVANADLSVFRSESTWPRAFFTDQVVTYSTASDFVTVLNRSDGRPFVAMQSKDSIPSGVAVGLSKDRSVVAAKNFKLTNNKTTFDVDVPHRGIVALSETWWNGDFRATIDGKRTDYFRLNHAFKGILVDAPGRHHVEFEYWPREFTTALKMATAGFAILIILISIVAVNPRSALIQCFALD